MNNDPDTINALNHLIAIHNRSLPVYLRSARPWAGRNSQEALQSLDEIADAHFQMVDRIAALVMELHGAVRTGEFPHRFADWHDLSVTFIISKAIELQKVDIARIEKCVGWLEGSPRGKALAQEALGEAKAHLESLQELAAKQAS